MVWGVERGVEVRSGWPACNQDQVIGWHRQSRHNRISVQASTRRHCDEHVYLGSVFLCKETHVNIHSGLLWAGIDTWALTCEDFPTCTKK